MRGQKQRSGLHAFRIDGGGVRVFPRILPAAPLKRPAPVDKGQVGIVPVRTLDLSIDEMLHELIAEIDARKATRLVLDSLTGFEMALAPEDRNDFRDSLYRLSTVLNAKGTTVLMTNELEDRYGEMRFSPYGSANLVDGVIMQRYVEWQSELHTVISVVKLRGSKHSRQIRLFEITDDGVVIGAAPTPAFALAFLLGAMLTECLSCSLYDKHFMPRIVNLVL